MTEVASSVVHEVLGQRAQDVDEPIIDYIINVLADDDFDFGLEGEGAFDAVGELLVAAGCVSDFNECRSVSSFSLSLHLISFEGFSLLLCLLARKVWEMMRICRFYDDQILNYLLFYGC